MPEPLLRSFVKICGVTTLDDAEAVIAAGADALGLILTASPRRLDVGPATHLADAVRGRILVTAVFRGEGDHEILDIVDAVNPDIVQLHGSLGETLRHELRRRGPLVVKAVSTGSEEFFSFDESSVDAVHVDGPRPGSGETHSWQDLTSRVFQRPLIAAGGLTPENVADIIQLTNAWGVDTSSGVESSPGVKDHAKVGAFVRRARRALDGKE